MIKSKLELKFYIASDRIMNGFPAKRNLIQILYLQPIITQYFIGNKSEIWSLSLIVHSKG